MIGSRWRFRFARPPVGLVVAFGLLAFGLTGCYTQLQFADAEAPSSSAERSVGERQDVRAGAIDPDNPLRSLRRATPASRAELVSLAKSLQEARADTEISFHEYREGVRFFRTNYPSFYGNYFGDPFYATYDIEYHVTARDAWRAGLDVNPWRDFRDVTAFLCAPHGYDPAFGCRSWVYQPSDFFFLPDVFALSGVARHSGRFLRSPFYRSLSFGYGGRWGLGTHGLYGYGSTFGYGGLYGYGGGLFSTGAGDVFEVNADERRENRARRGTVGRGGTGAGADADRSREAGTRTDRARSAEGPDRRSSGARDARQGRSADDRDARGRAERSERGADDRERSEASEMRGDAIRRPQMLIAPVFSGAGDEASALAEVEHVTLETVRVSPPSIEGQNRADAIRTYRALQRIAETTDARSVSIQHQGEMSATIRHLQRAQNAYRAGDATGRHRGSNIGRREYGTSRTSGRSSAGREVRSTRDRGQSASGQSRSDRGSRGGSGRDRSRSGSSDSGGRR